MKVFYKSLAFRCFIVACISFGGSYGTLKAQKLAPITKEKVELRASTVTGLEDFFYPVANSPGTYAAKKIMSVSGNMVVLADPAVYDSLNFPTPGAGGGVYHSGWNSGSRNYFQSSAINSKQQINLKRSFVLESRMTLALAADGMSIVFHNDDGSQHLDYDPAFPGRNVIGGTRNEGYPIGVYHLKPPTAAAEPYVVNDSLGILHGIAIEFDNSNNAIVDQKVTTTTPNSVWDGGITHVAIHETDEIYWTPGTVVGNGLTPLREDINPVTSITSSPSWSAGSNSSWQLSGTEVTTLLSAGAIVPVKIEWHAPSDGAVGNANKYGILTVKIFDPVTGYNFEAGQEMKTLSARLNVAAMAELFNMTTEYYDGSNEIDYTDEWNVRIAYADAVNYGAHAHFITPKDSATAVNQCLQNKIEFVRFAYLGFDPQTSLRMYAGDGTVMPIANGEEMKVEYTFRNHMVSSASNPALTFDSKISVSPDALKNVDWSTMNIVSVKDANERDVTLYSDPTLTTVIPVSDYGNQLCPDAFGDPQYVYVKNGVTPTTLTFTIKAKEETGKFGKDADIWMGMNIEQALLGFGESLIETTASMGTADFDPWDYVVYDKTIERLTSNSFKIDLSAYLPDTISYFTANSYPAIKTMPYNVMLTINDPQGGGAAFTGAVDQAIDFLNAVQIAISNGEIEANYLPRFTVTSSNGHVIIFNDTTNNRNINQIILKLQDYQGGIASPVFSSAGSPESSGSFPVNSDGLGKAAMDQLWASYVDLDTVTGPIYYLSNPEPNYYFTKEFYVNASGIKEGKNGTITKDYEKLAASLQPTDAQFRNIRIENIDIIDDINDIFSVTKTEPDDEPNNNPGISRIRQDEYYTRVAFRRQTITNDGNKLQQSIWIKGTPGYNDTTAIRTNSLVSGLYKEGKNPYLYNPLYVYITTGEPSITRSVYLPVIDGATTDPSAGTSYVRSQDDFIFYVIPDPGQTLTYLKVTTGIPIRDNEGIRYETLEDGSVKVTILNVTEPLTLTISGISPTSNIILDSEIAAWSYNEILYVKTNEKNELTVYTVSGQLLVQQNISEGTTPISVPKGIYIVKLDNGFSKKVSVN